MAAVVEYKYTPDQMPVEELKQTFAARHHLLHHVLAHLRQQAQSSTLSSFLIIGPRGAGKTTLVLMLCESIREDAELSAAWLPVRLREEQFDVCSLRDMLAAVIRSLAEEGLAAAGKWLSQVEQADDEEQSQSLAVAGLREIAKASGKRLVLFVENLNLVLRRALDDASQATLRRLLMVDPFLMLIGTAVCTFEEIEGYDKALFNYFHPLHLENLSDDQICELLTRRAEYDRNTSFLEHLGEHRPKLRAIARLTGGNPRFILMAYEILSEGQVTSAVQALERLVDELTPMLKHVLEGLPPQQAKIVDALMRAGGTATPAALAQATRLKLNVVTAQLRRLKDNRMVEVLGGGKGQTAHYTVPDQLFCTWYQMRYLQRNRRRIELFTEVIRLWFEAEERLEHLQRLAGHAVAGGARPARSLAENAEYFAAALRDTPFEDDAKRLMIQTWLHAGEFAEAAMALADLSLKEWQRAQLDDIRAILDLSQWCQKHHMLPQALETARDAAEKRPADLQAQIAYASCVNLAGDTRLFRDQITRCLALPIAELERRVLFVVCRAVANVELGERKAAVEDFAVAIQLAISSRDPAFTAGRIFHVIVQCALGRYASVIADASQLIESCALGGEEVAAVLACRAFARLKLNDRAGAQADFNDALAKAHLPAEKLQELFVAALELALKARATELGVFLADQFVALIELAPDDKQVAVLVKTATLAAKPDTRESWPIVLRRMHEKLPAKTAQRIVCLLPVAEVLEGKDRSVLDPLPPQERAFALEVLERFKPKGDKPEEPDIPEAAPTASHAQIARDEEAAGDQ